jgi:hypothetical protein
MRNDFDGILRLRDRFDALIDALADDKHDRVCKSGPITVAEYQIFVDDELRKGIYRQPDHWLAADQPLQARHSPVLGVRGRDALRFCDWFGSQSWNHKIRDHRRIGNVRLPDSIELNAAQGESDIGIISYSQGRFHFWQTSTEAERYENAFFLNILKHYDADLSYDFDLTLHRNIDMNTSRDRALEVIRNRNTAGLLQQRLRARKPSMNALLNINPDLYLDQPSRLLKAYLTSRDVMPDPDGFIALGRDLVRAVYEADNMARLRAYLLCIYLMWDYLFIHLQEGKRGTVCPHDIEQALALSEITFNLYCYAAMIQLRQNGSLPAWGSLYIICERDIPNREFL